MSSSILHVPIDDHLREQATHTLAAMGLTVPDAIREFLLHVIADKALPFAMEASLTPNETSRLAMAEAEEIIQRRNPRFKQAKALFDDLEKNSIA